MQALKAIQVVLLDGKHRLDPTWDGLDDLQSCECHRVMTLLLDEGVGDALDEARTGSHDYHKLLLGCATLSALMPPYLQ